MRSAFLSSLTASVMENACVREIDCLPAKRDKFAAPRTAPRSETNRQPPAGVNRIGKGANFINRDRGASSACSVDAPLLHATMAIGTGGTSTLVVIDGISKGERL